MRQQSGDRSRLYDTAVIPADTISGKLSPGLVWKYYKGIFPWVISPYHLEENASGVSASLNGKDALHKEGQICYEGYIRVPVNGKYYFPFYHAE